MWLSTKLSWLLLGAAPFAHNAVAQFISQPTDLTTKTGYAGIPVRYKQVPTGICELDPNVKSFSGYADVEKDQHIFFWFFESRNIDPTTAPLTVWINGGPGASSMMGLFQELGPCGIDYFGEVYSNPYSWTNVSNMLFIDQPTQVGFSYSEAINGVMLNNGTIVEVPEGSSTCPEGAQCGTFSRPDEALTANSTANAAPNMWKTIQGFMGVFPQYSRGGFNFASESYGGHYIPVFADYVEKQNAANIPGAKKINLESVMIGNGWYDPITQYSSYYNFTVSPGNTYDFNPYNETTAAKLYDNIFGPGNCIEGLKQHCVPDGDNDACSKADQYCSVNVESFYGDNTGRDEYDIREFRDDPFPYGFFEGYLNSAKLQQAIGAFTNYSAVSDTVGDAFSATADDGREVGSIEDLRCLLRQNVTVALFAGDADYNCNWMGGQEIARKVCAPGWSQAGYVDISTDDGVVNGQVKQSGKFSFTRVYESGHEVPFYQPILALAMFERVINGRDIATGKQVADDSYRTEGSVESTYREGNGTMQWEPVSVNSTYDITTGKPGAPWTRGKSLFRVPTAAKYKMRR